MGTTQCERRYLSLSLKNNRLFGLFRAIKKKIEQIQQAIWVGLIIDHVYDRVL